MKNKIKIIAFTCLLSSLFILSNSDARKQANNVLRKPSNQTAENADAEIKKLIKKSGLNINDLGMVVSLANHDSKIIFENNFNKKFIPASITKIFTTAAVLKNLSPHYKVKTQILSNAQVDGQTLKGNLYLRGAGDPGFVSETMWFLVNSFVRNNITTIVGDVVIDDTLFDSSRFDKSRQPERVDRAYDAPTGAMSFNWNSINIFVRPASKKGAQALVFADPENTYINLINKVKTVGDKDKQEVLVSRIDGKNNQDTIIVDGTIRLNSSELVVYKNITQPDIWSGKQLLEFLKQRGIRVTGEVKIGKTPADSKVLAEAESKPVAQMVQDMNKFSNNYVAEMLTKLLSLKKSSQGNIETGMLLIKEYLSQIGVKEDEYILINPSGLTRDNRFTTKTMYQSLTDLYNSFDIFPEFLSSLPIAGLDGTLKSRMKGTQAEGWVRAKTGYLTGVISLAGFAANRDGELFLFSFMYNGSADEAKVRSFFDQVLLKVIE